MKQNYDGGKTTVKKAFDDMMWIKQYLFLLTDVWPQWTEQKITPVKDFQVEKDAVKLHCEHRLEANSKQT